MNEIFTLILIYFVLCFSDLIPTVELQYKIGYLFIGFMALCICVHLFFIFSDMAHQLMLLYKRHMLKRESTVGQRGYRQRSRSILGIIFSCCRKENKTGAVIKDETQVMPPETSTKRLFLLGDPENKPQADIESEEKSD